MSVIVKQCITVFLGLALLIQTFSQAVIVVDFYANRDYIARNLCVNRDKPMMHCGGKCQLCKRLDQDNGNKDKSSPERKISFTASPLSAETAFAGIVVMALPALLHGPGCCDSRIIDRPSFCFHPPD